MFLDESGEISRQDQLYYILGALVINSDKYNILYQIVEATIKYIKDKFQFDIDELKGSNIFNMLRKRSSNLDEALKYYSEIVCFVVERLKEDVSDFEVILVGIDKGKMNKYVENCIEVKRGVSNYLNVLDNDMMYSLIRQSILSDIFKFLRKHILLFQVVMEIILRVKELLEEG